MSSWVMPIWLLDVMACPACSGELDTDPRGVLRCNGRCGVLYPVLAGVPILIAGADRWMASYRESILAALAERGLAGEHELELIDIFAGAGGAAEPRRWNDDWVAAEADGDWPEVPGRHAASFGAFVDAAASQQPARLVPRLLAGGSGTAIELGVGAGEVAAALAGQFEQLIVADLSLRAVLGARELAGEEVAAVVIDADRVRFRPASLDAAVAINLVDLIELPEQLCDTLAGALADGGRLVLTTPDPGLGDPDGGDLIGEIVGATGLEIEVDEDHVPWLRPHRDREWQLYFNRLLVARQPGAAPS
jgi:SAM-dependent methyltransferase/uncharacterized protein YbaR (Trm112 family)